MRTAIEQIKIQQGRVIALLEEYQKVKEFERLQTIYPKFYILKDGFLLDNTGAILVDTCNGTKPGRIKSYLSIRGIKEEQILDFN